ncbi:MAG: peptidylprolyl isomerase [Acidobacteria bacterium]|nr:peptidylprolyl isomerase [Acidobacteriota bacterium]
MNIFKAGNNNVLPVFTMLLALILLSVSCGGDSEQGQDIEEEEFIITRNIASVRGEIVKLSEYLDYLKYEVDPDLQPDLDNELKSYYLERLLERVALLKEAQKASITIVQKELNDRIEELKSQLSDEIIKDEEIRNLFSDPGWVSHLEKSMVIQKYVDLVITSTVVVSQNEEEDYYNKNYSRQTSSRMYSLSQIIVADRATAQSIKDELKKNKAKFQELAKQYSTSPDGKNGGDIGWYSSEQLPESILNAIRKLNVNDISDIIETDAGLVIIKLDQVKNSERKSFYEMKEVIQQELLEKKREIKLNEHIDKIWSEKKTKTTGIEIFPDNLNFIYTPMRNRG